MIFLIFVTQVPFWSATTRGRVLRLRHGIPGSDQAVVSRTADSCPLHQAAQHRGGGSPHQGLEWQRICSAIFCSEVFDLFLIVTGTYLRWRPVQVLQSDRTMASFFILKWNSQRKCVNFPFLKLFHKINLTELSCRNVNLLLLWNYFRKFCISRNFLNANSCPSLLRFTMLSSLFPPTSQTRNDGHC